MKRFLLVLVCFSLFGCSGFVDDPKTGLSPFNVSSIEEACYKNHKYIKLPQYGTSFTLTPLLDDSGKPVLCMTEEVECSAEKQ